MISLEDFSHILKVLYSTPLEPEEWNTFLDLLVQHTGSAGAYLLVADRRQNLSIRMQGGVAFDEEGLRKYAQEIAPIDPYRLEAIRHGAEGVVDLGQWVPTDKLESSAMYQHLLKPTRLCNPVTMMLSCTLTRLAGVSLWRHPEQGKLPKEGWRLLELLLPHVRAVLDVRKKLGTIRDQLKGAEAVADASGTPTLLVSGTGRVIHANTAAEALLKEADALQFVKNKLRAVEGEADASLRVLLKRVAGGAGDVPSASVMVVPRQNGRAALQIMASPVPGMRARGADAVLLVISDPERPLILPEDAMRELYGMTTAEVEVASGLLTGYTLEEIAELRKVAVGTVRMQLKSIFGKTKTHKQAELVRLLMRMPGVAETRSHEDAGKARGQRLS